MQCLSKVTPSGHEMQGDGFVLTSFNVPVEKCSLPVFHNGCLKNLPTLCRVIPAPETNTLDEV